MLWSELYQQHCSNPRRLAELMSMAWRRVATANDDVLFSQLTVGACTLPRVLHALDARDLPPGQEVRRWASDREAPPGSMSPFSI
jgi:hypothetical protein